MRTRAINPVARGTACLASGAVVAAVFAYLFLGSAPVQGVTDLYWGLHLDSVMALDDLFGLCHVSVYVVLTVVLGNFTRTATGWIAIFAALTALGVGVEFVQGAVGGRQFSFEDMLANFVGVCVGFLLLVLLTPDPARRRTRR